MFLLLPSCRGPVEKQTVSSSDIAVGDAASTRISPAGASASEPAMAADRSGSIDLLYVEHTAGDAADIYLQKLDGTGSPLGERVRINPEAASAKAWKGDPPTIALGPDNTVYVGWTRKYADENTKGNDLMLSVSTDGGTNFAAPVKVNDDTKPASHGMHSLAVDSRGKVYMAWLDERSIAEKETHREPEHHGAMSMAMFHHADEEAEPNSEVYYAVSADGGKTFLPNKRIAVEACPCCKTTIAVAPDDTIYAAWRQVLGGDRRHIAVAHSYDKGVTFSEGVVVSDDNWQINACPVSGAGLLAADNNSLYVMWYTAGTAGAAGVYYSVSLDGGKTFPPRTLVSSEAASGTPLLLRSGSGGATAIFAGTGDRILFAAEFDSPRRGIERKLPDAGLPASTVSNGKIVTAFIRNADEKNSVWITF